MDFAASAFELKNLDESGRIEGLLAGFGDVDNGGDKLLAGCFTASLKARKTPLPMLLHHDTRRPIGAWTSWEERPEGLFTKGKMTLTTRDAQEAFALAKDGALTGLSIGWRSKREVLDDRSGVRTVVEAELIEGSLVAIPMHDRARVSSIKSISRAQDIADLLREAGLTSRKAKLAAGMAWKALENDDGGADQAELVAILNASVARIATL